MGFFFNRFLNGTTVLTEYSVWRKVNSDISQTTLVHHITQLTVPDFPRALERKFSDLVLSMLGSSVLQDGLNQRISVPNTPCTVTSPAQRWEYHPFWMALSYGIAAGLSLVVVVAGGYAIRRHGYAMDTLFSTMLTTTRNEEIDALVSGYSLGRSPLPEKILGSRLQFGEIVGVEGGKKHVAFGLEGRVRPVVFGKRYSR